MAHPQRRRLPTNRGPALTLHRFAERNCANKPASLSVRSPETRSSKLLAIHPAASRRRRRHLPEADLRHCSQPRGINHHAVCGQMFLDP
jgi:hypothetical protein